MILDEHSSPQFVYSGIVNAHAAIERANIIGDAKQFFYDSAIAVIISAMDDNSYSREMIFETLPEILKLQKFSDIDMVQNTLKRLHMFLPETPKRDDLSRRGNDFDLVSEMQEFIFACEMKAVKRPVLQFDHGLTAQAIGGPRRVIKPASVFEMNFMWPRG